MISSYHRILDTGEGEHKVHTVATAHHPKGGVYAVEGVMVELTGTVYRETAATAREAVAGATAHHAVIEGPKGC